MNVGPNLLHLVLMVCALAGVALAARELRYRPLHRRRLIAPVFAAAAGMALFFLLKIGTGHPPWTFGIALAAGLAAGVVRGTTLRLQVDHMFGTVRLSSARGSFLVALGMVGAVLLEVVGAFAGPAGEQFRLMAPEIAALCAGVLIGRWIAIQIRWSREPHFDLHRM